MGSTLASITLNILTALCATMQGRILLVFIKTITNKKPIAVAQTIWHNVDTSSAPDSKLIICPMPNVTLETITADLILSFAIA